VGSVALASSTFQARSDRCATAKLSSRVEGPLDHDDKLAGINPETRIRGSPIPHGSWGIRWNPGDFHARHGRC
jgi:hypothetical protein